MMHNTSNDLISLAVDSDVSYDTWLRAVKMQLTTERTVKKQEAMNVATKRVIALTSKFENDALMAKYDMEMFLFNEYIAETDHEFVDEEPLVMISKSKPVPFEIYDDFAPASPVAMIPQSTPRSLRRMAIHNAYFRHIDVSPIPLAKDIENITEMSMLEISEFENSLSSEVDPAIDVASQETFNMDESYRSLEMSSLLDDTIDMYNAFGIPRITV